MRSSRLFIVNYKVLNRLCELIESGTPIVAAAKACGVSAPTVYKLKEQSAYAKRRIESALKKKKDNRINGFDGKVLKLVRKGVYSKAAIARNLSSNNYFVAQSLGRLIGARQVRRIGHGAYVYILPTRKRAK